MKVWVLCGYDCLPFAVCRTKKLAYEICKNEKITGRIQNSTGFFRIVSGKETEATANRFNVIERTKK